MVDDARAPTASRAYRRCGIPRSPRSRCRRRAALRAVAAAERAPRLAAAASSCWMSRATGSAQPPAPARWRLGVPVREQLLPRPGRHGGDRLGDAPRARPAALRRAVSSGRSTGWSACRARNGGFAAFDVDNTHYRLNYIPFADHGALLDPPTSDVTARVVTVLALAGPRRRTGRRSSARSGLPARRAGAGRLLVRSLGNELHLRHLVGADGARAGARRPDDDPAVVRAVRWLERAAERGRRLGREQRHLRAGRGRAPRRWPAPPTRLRGRCSG